MSDFRVYSTDGQIDGVSLYFVESTAPDSVEQRVNLEDAAPPGLKAVDPDQAVRNIARDLAPEGMPQVDANLVVMVHGFNTPRDRVLEFYDAARRAILADKDAISDAGRRTVCVGYRWPSESIGSVVGSSLSALPIAPLSLLAGALASALAVVWVILSGFKLMAWGSPDLVRDLALVVAAGGIVLILTIAVFALLRAIVYFRDIYRATNYGVPDLVEVIRQIDLETSDWVQELRRRGETARKRIALSFIGHSMGGLLVTNTIRVLSDVFDRAAIRTRLSGEKRAGPATDAPGGLDTVPGELGHVFTLMRFVLASPDIPAETLLADRANFLASSLRRFREAYLFSNEGDEVLQLISTTVNYFSFPTLRRQYGYRLGNLEMLTSSFGLSSNANSLDSLRTGSESLSALSSDTTRQKDPSEVAKAFTYFDCTDYVDGDPPKGMLTEARNYKQRDPKGRIPYLEHVKLLLLYALGGKSSINVHGGYFDGAVTQRLIYRLACLGFQGAAHAYGDERQLLDECKNHQIRVMCSERLSPKNQREREDMDLS